MSLVFAVSEAATSSDFTVSMTHWITFCVGVVIFLVLDLFVFHRDSHEPSLRESAGWTIFWTSLALGFNVLIYFWGGKQAGLEFFTGYLLEWTLSMDNVFVFVVIFSYFRVPLKYQYRVLFWGILGAIVLRLSFILVAGELLENFEWMIALFGLVLIVSGIKMALAHDSEPEPEKNFLLRLARKLFPVAKESHGDKFFAKENGVLCITPLFLVLLVVESTDVIFAIDSVPAIYGVTNNAFIVFTSNVFAIMGLRALYFLLAGVIDMFRYLSYGLSAVLVFIGLKMTGVYFSQFFTQSGESWHPPQLLPLAVIACLLATSIIASLIANARDRRKAAAEDRKPEEPVE